MAASYTIQKSAAGYMHCIYLSPADVKKLTKGGNKRVICTLNGKLSIHAALMRTKEGNYYVMISNQHLKTLGLKSGGTVKAAFKIDDTELQFPMPEELAEVLATDPAADKVFQSLTAGNKRGLMALVNRVKSSDKKIGYALLIAEKLKKGISSPAKIMQR